jgi:nucleotide-binding universal stress UspA family protein
MNTTLSAPQADPNGGLARADSLVRIHDVLFPSDLSPPSDRAFDHAAFLAERFGAMLTIYHAVEVPDPSYAHWAFQSARDIWIQVEKSAREELTRRAQSLHVSAEVQVQRAASVQQALLSFIHDAKPDLVVMATHGREGLSHLMLGSVTESVFRHSSRPVLCVREPEHGGALPYRRILLPTDLSLASRLAFPLAGRFARHFDAEIIAVHVLGHGSSQPYEGEPSEAWLYEFFERDLRGLEITAQVHRGRVWERIVEAARAERADLIVMSTRGHDSLADRMVGSNTERVVRHAPCPVLVA